MAIPCEAQQLQTANQLRCSVFAGGSWYERANDLDALATSTTAIAAGLYFVLTTQANKVLCRVAKQAWTRER